MCVHVALYYYDVCAVKYRTAALFKYWEVLLLFWSGVGRTAALISLYWWLCQQYDQVLSLKSQALGFVIGMTDSRSVHKQQGQMEVHILLSWLYGKSHTSLVSFIYCSAQWLAGKGACF